jgi:hypothetical protein
VTPIEVAPPPPLPPKSGHELFAEALRQLRQEKRADESRAYHETVTQQQADKERIARAGKMLETSGLGAAIELLIETMWHYHAWLYREKDPYLGHTHLRLVSLSAKEIVEGKAKGFRVEWQMDEDAPMIALSFVEAPRFFMGDSFLFADATIHWDGLEVLKLTLSHNLEDDREYYNWHCMAPSILIPGEWAYAILEVEHRIRMEKQRQYLERESRRLREQAKGLPPV